MSERVCELCGGSMEGKRSDSRFCTKKCKSLISKRRYWAAHPEKRKEAKRLYYAKHPDKKKESARRWYLANTEKAKQRAADWVARNPLKAQEIWLRRDNNKRIRRAFCAVAATMTFMQGTADHAND